MTGFDSKRQAAMDKLVATQEELGMYDDQKPAQEPQVRTGDCLRVGVCASEGHKIQAQRPWVGLTDFDHARISAVCLTPNQAAISAAYILKEKNT